MGDEYGWRDTVGSLIFCAIGFGVFYAITLTGAPYAIAGIVAGAVALLATAPICGYIEQRISAKELE